MRQATRQQTPPEGPRHTLGRAAGAAPLVAGESKNAYEQLLASIIDALAPADMLEHILIRDVVDLSWTALRLRRLHANLMAAARFEGMGQLHLSMWDHGYGRKTARDRDPGDPLAHIQAEVARTELTMDHVNAYVFATRLADFERIERMTAAAETRRDQALCRLDLYRCGQAPRLRQALQAIEAAGATGDALQTPAGNSPHDQHRQARGQPAQRPA
jgi:hypothetical protein